MSRRGAALSQEILFWRRAKNSQESRPWPTELVDTTIPEEKRQLVADILKRGKVLGRYRGMATCRLCGEMLGNADMGGFGFFWPSKAEHYVLKHDVWLGEFDLMLRRAKEPI